MYIVILSTFDPASQQQQLPYMLWMEKILEGELSSIEIFDISCVYARQAKCR